MALFNYHRAAYRFWRRENCRCRRKKEHTTSTRCTEISLQLWPTNVSIQRARDPTPSLLSKKPWKIYTFLWNRPKAPRCRYNAVYIFRCSSSNLNVFQCLGIGSYQAVERRGQNTDSASADALAIWSSWYVKHLPQVARSICILFYSQSSKYTCSIFCVVPAKEAKKVKEKIKKMASKVEEENFDGDLEMVRNLFYDIRSWKQKKKIWFCVEKVPEIF